MAAHEGISVRRMTVLLIVAVALLGWAFAAAGYAQAVDGWHARQGAGEVAASAARHVRGRGLSMLAVTLWDFFLNAVLQIPNLFAVLGFTFRERFWLPVTFAVIEILVLVGSWRLAALEKEMWAKRRWRR